MLAGFTTPWLKKCHYSPIISVEETTFLLKLYRLCMEMKCVMGFKCAHLIKADNMQWSTSCLKANLLILQEHSNEVWFLQFSHNGDYLASSSSDCLVIMWEVKVDG